MNVQLVKRLLTTNQINMTDVNTFVTEYVLEKKKRDVTIDELNKITILLQNGTFNLRYALLDAANILGLTVMTAADSQGRIIHTNVY